jgi:hypothetical protein
MLSSRWKSFLPSIAAISFGVVLIIASQVIEAPAQIKELEDLRSSSNATLTVVPEWTVDTAYLTDQLVVRAGITYRRTTPGTSGALFDANNWTILATGRAAIGDVITNATIGSVLVVGADDEFQQDNANLFWDDSNDRLGIGTATPLHDLHIAGSQMIEYTAAEADVHAFDVWLDAVGLGDVKAVDINYTTGALQTGNDEAAILVNVDESLASGGDVAALEVLATEGSAKIIGIEVGALVDPITQLSGGFADADTVDNNGSVITTLNGGGAGNVSVFTADNDYMIIGSATKFEEIEYLLATGASGSGIAPTFEFSTGVGMWSFFTPTDGTNGIGNTGVILWLDSDIPSWATGAGGEFLIRITRTRNNLTATPVANKLQIVGAVEYGWDKDAAISVSSISVGSSGVTITSGTGTPEGSVAAPIGSTYHREDGGAGTSFYVKESGGATSAGWVGK